jgi:hypothetical protein
MLDLSGPVAALFEAELAGSRDGIYHHYTTVIARRL